MDKAEFSLTAGERRAINNLIHKLAAYSRESAAASRQSEQEGNQPSAAHWWTESREADKQMAAMEGFLDWCES